MARTKARRSAAAPAARMPRSAPEPQDRDAELNWQIIALLQEDGRMPFSAIAAKTGVSEGTIRNRYKQLKDDNVMAVAASVLPEAFGYRWNSTILLRLDTTADVDKVAQRLARVPEIYYIVQLTGRHDLGVAAYHRDREHFREFLAKHLYGHPEIREIESSVNLKVYKIRTHWRESRP